MAVMAKSAVSAKLKRLRLLWGTDGKPLRQTDAAARIGVSRRSWISWERGDREPPQAVAMLIDLLLKNLPGY
jgi:DNA-binding XRE family transcriptional regulator